MKSGTELIFWLEKHQQLIVLIWYKYIRIRYKSSCLRLIPRQGSYSLNIPVFRKKQFWWVKLYSQLIKNIKEWKNSTCWLVLVAIVIWFSVLLKLRWHIIIH